MDQIYYNGDIITMVKETDSPEALCVKDGRIQFIGTREEAFSYRTKETELIDLNGKTLLPGFIDSHSHIVSFSNLLGTIDLQGCTDFDMIVNRLKKGIEEKKLEPGQWVIGFGYDHNCLKEKRHPDKYILDRASTEHPILVSHVSGHMGVLNSSALKQSGIDESTPDPEGGKIGRLQGSSQPDGYLEETAFTGCSSNMPAPSATQLIRQMQLAQEVYLKHGITTAQEGLAGTVEWEQLKQLAQNGELNIDVVAYADMKSSRSLMKENKKYRGTYINHLKLGGYKIFLDGSPQGRTAWMSEPYEGAEDGYSGYPIYTDGQVREYMQEAVQDHAQLLVHCNGDAAAQQMIDAYRTCLLYTS